MTLAIGDAPFLRRESLQALVELNRAEEYEQGYAIQQLFMSDSGQPRLVESEKTRVEYTRPGRIQGILHSSPSDPDPVTTDSAGYKLVESLYQQYEYLIPPNHSALMRPVGVPNNQAGVAADAAVISAMHSMQAEAMTARQTKLLTQKTLRTWEIWSAQHLSTETFSLVVDGVTQTVTTNITRKTTAADWATAGTDIPAHLGLMWEQFLDQAAGPPTHMITSARLVSDLASNTAVRAVTLPVLGRLPITVLPLDILPAELRGATQLVSSMHYINTSGSKAYVWPNYIMTWLRLLPGSQVLDFVYAPTRRNDFGRSGSAINGRSYYDGRNLTEHVIVDSNGVPVVLNEDQIMQFDVSGP